MTENPKESNIVPFGKYKGQPVEVLENDQGYVEWLQGQGWVKDRFPQFYTVIINNLSETDDTPEHNAFQALFLDDPLCIKLINLVLTIENKKERHGKYRNCLTSLLSNLDGKIFEAKDGADVVLYASLWRLTEWQERNPSYWRAGGPEWIRKQGWGKDRISISLELKPSLGDDYPGVLRKAKRLSADHICVVYKEFNAIGVTAEQVKQMFAQSCIYLFPLSEIKSASSRLQIEEPNQ